MRMLRKFLTAVTTTAVLAGGTLLAAPGVALAQPTEGVGYRTTPGQGYRERPVRAYDWMGSYMVNDSQVWCVQYALKAPDSHEEYQPGDALKTKWGEPLSPSVAANISYLLLRHGDTHNPDEAAALAHLLHSWTAPPRSPADVLPDKSFKDIAYNIDFQYNKLPQAAKDAVRAMRADAEANRGPWKAGLTAPAGQQTIGSASDWTLRVQRGNGRGVSNVPVALHVADAKVDGLANDGTVTTPADGKPLTLHVTPTGPNPKVSGSLVAPADRPYVRNAVNQPDTTQRVVSTGGEQKLSVEASAKAVTAAGSVRVGKVDTDSKAGIEGVLLRVTAADGMRPAIRQDGSSLIGPDGQPAVVNTGADGTSALADFRTPQEIRVTEIKPARGYEQAYDASAPPSVSGLVRPAGTLLLTLTNKANTPSVPIKIPAGDPTALGETVELPTRRAINTAVLTLGSLALAGAGIGGGVALRRRLRESRHQ